MSEPQTLFDVGERDRGKRLDQFLHERIPGLSRARIRDTVQAPSLDEARLREADRAICKALSWRNGAR